MNGGPSAPTTADYAHGAAQDAKHEIEKLKKRIDVLEKKVEALCLVVASEGAEK